MTTTLQSIHHLGTLLEPTGALWIHRAPRQGVYVARWTDMPAHPRCELNASAASPEAACEALLGVLRAKAEGVKDARGMLTHAGRLIAAGKAEQPSRCAMDRVERAAGMALAALPFVGTFRAARELSNNVCSVLLVDESDGCLGDVETICREAIEHRITHGWVRCADVTGCARAMTTAWMTDARKSA